MVCLSPVPKDDSTFDCVSIGLERVVRIPGQVECVVLVAARSRSPTLNLIRASGAKRMIIGVRNSALLYRMTKLVDDCAKRFTDIFVCEKRVVHVERVRPWIVLPCVISKIIEVDRDWI